jgi:hypothetical protein
MRNPLVANHPDTTTLVASLASLQVFALFNRYETNPVNPPE